MSVEITMNRTEAYKAVARGELVCGISDDIFWAVDGPPPGPICLYVHSKGIVTNCGKSTKGPTLPDIGFRLVSDPNITI